MKKVFTLLLVATTTISCVQLKSKPLGSSAGSYEGFYYTLPKTFINVEFGLKQTKITKGIYFNYAECLGLPSVELDKIQEKTTYEIDEVNITNNAYLDKDHIYQLDLNQKFLNRSDFKLEYATNGELSSAEISNESQILPAIITTLNVVADIAGGVSFLGKTDKGFDCANLPQFIKNELNELSDIDTAILKLLNSGPDGLSQEQLEYRLKELKTLKSNIISKFTATVKTKIVKYSFELDPKDITSPKPLFKYNKDLGFERVYKTNPHNTQKPIDDKMPFNHNFSVAENASNVTIDFVYKDNSISQAIDTKKGSQKEGSFYYRIPATVKYKVMIAKKNIGEATLPIPQMGTTVAAPKKLRNITFKLYPGLGSIYTVRGKTDSLRFGEIDSLRKTVFTDKNTYKIKKLKEAIEIRNLERELNGESGTTEVDSEDEGEESSNSDGQ